MTFALGFFPERPDFFPFYSWGMFSDVRGTTSLFRLRIDCLQQSCGLDLDYFNHRQQFQADEGRKVFLTINAFALAQINGLATFSSYEAQFAQLLLKEHDSLQYSLVRSNIDLLKFARTRQVEGEEVLIRRRCMRLSTGIQCSAI